MKNQPFVNFAPVIRFYGDRITQLKTQRRRIRRHVLWLRFKQLFSL